MTKKIAYNVLCNSFWIKITLEDILILKFKGRTLKIIIYSLYYYLFTIILYYLFTDDAYIFVIDTSIIFSFM